MKKGKYNRNLKALCVTLIILTVLGVFSQAENSIVSSGINAASKGLFKLTASAAASCTKSPSTAFSTRLRGGSVPSLAVECTCRSTCMN